MKFLMIAKSNMKKTKSATVTLLFLIIMSTILLYVGISVKQYLGEFIYNKNNDLNGSHFITIIPEKFKDPVTETIKGIEGFDYMEVNEGIMYSSPKIKNISREDKEKNLSTLIQKIDNNNEISKLKIIDEGSELKENSVILPYIFKVSENYKTGDEIQIVLGEDKYVFQVYGFYEDVIFGNPINIMTYKFFVYEDTFETLLENENVGIRQLVCNVILDDSSKAEGFETEYTRIIKEKVTDSTYVNSTMNIEAFASGTTMFISIIAVILVAFSFIILVIALIVINFSIVTHIESNMSNIGSLQALGYTSKQIIRSIILEFQSIAMVGWSIGMAIALLITPIVTKVVSSSIGLDWNSKISLGAMAFSMVIIITLVFVITYLASRKIKKITPLIALRSGIEDHSFNKNYLPLSKSKFSLNISIGLKGLLKNYKENIVVSLIVSSLCFACVFCFITYYNMSVNNKALLKMTGMETGEIKYQSHEELNDKLVKEISELDEVTKIVKLDNIDIMVSNNENKVNVGMKICDDYSTLNIETIVDGRQPKFDNEIVLTRKIMEELNVKIGDTVSVIYNDAEKEFLVVGRTQQIFMLGRGCGITDEGMRRLLPDYKIRELRINLKEGANIDDFRTSLISKYKFSENEIVNHSKTLDETLSSFSGTVNMICVATIIITIITVALILFQLIRVKLIKERQRLGIFKAIGFVTKELISHVVIAFMPVVVLGSIVGTILGTIGTNFIMKFLMSGSGIENVEFIVKLVYVVLPPLGICLLSLITILIVAGRIRKISPFEFLVE